jgi:hypothetical protein
MEILFFFPEKEAERYKIAEIQTIAALVLLSISGILYLSALGYIIIKVIYRFKVGVRNHKATETHEIVRDHTSPSPSPPYHKKKVETTSS